MAREKKEYVKGKAELEFEEKYRSLIEELKVMPKETEEDREYRFKWMSKHKEYSALALDLLDIISPGIVRKIPKDLATKVSETLGENAYMANIYEKEYDTVNFQEAVVETIKTYTGISKRNGNPYTFLQGVRRLYNQRVGKTAIQNDLQFSMHDVSKKNWTTLLKVVRTVCQMREARPTHKRVEELIEECLASSRYNFPKKDIEIAVKYVYNLNIECSLHQSISDNEEELTLEDVLGNLDSGFDSLEKKEEEKSFIDCLAVDFEDKWETVVKASGVRDREWIRVFLARDILFALKMDFLKDEKERKENQGKREAYCCDWCSNSRCFYPSKKTSCFVRYEEKKHSAQTGNVDVYELLKKFGDGFYNTILKNEYIKYAYRDEVKGIDDMHFVKLKPYKSDEECETFNFSGATIGRVLGASKYVVNDCKKAYKNKALPALKKIFAMR